MGLLFQKQCVYGMEAGREAVAEHDHLDLQVGSREKHQLQHESWKLQSLWCATFHLLDTKYSIMWGHGGRYISTHHY